MGIVTEQYYRPVNECDWRHPWPPVKKALDASSSPHSFHHYHKSDNTPLSTTIGVQAERLAPGYTAPESQEQSSFMYHVFEGKGHTLVESPTGEKFKFDWESRDTFAVPSWSKIQHVNESATEPAYLIAVHDRPFLDLLGLVRPGN